MTHSGLVVWINPNGASMALSLTLNMVRFNTLIRDHWVVMNWMIRGGLL